MLHGIAGVSWSCPVRNVGGLTGPARPTWHIWSVSEFDEGGDMGPSKRKLFEEVGSRPQRGAEPAVGLIDRTAGFGRAGSCGGLLGSWCFSAARVIMIAVGGGSPGLKPFPPSHHRMGADLGGDPPMSAEDLAGRNSTVSGDPEYQLQNHGMSLEEFKVIYWWEMGPPPARPGHRPCLEGLGFLGSVATANIPAWLDPGGHPLPRRPRRPSGGPCGWWMVSSGLTGNHARRGLLPARERISGSPSSSSGSSPG